MYKEKMTKEEKQLKWISTKPGLIEKPLHYIYSVLGPTNNISITARRYANKGEGQAVSAMARGILVND